MPVMAGRFKLMWCKLRKRKPIRIRHPREGGDPVYASTWIPAFAGMTIKFLHHISLNHTLMRVTLIVRKNLFLILFLATSQAMADISVLDDVGQTVVLKKPAERIISLAPHITELLFAVDGGKRIAGTISYSDYPPEAKNIPLIGDDRQIDMERIIALKPDLLVVWLHGNTERQVEQLRQLGIPLFNSEPHKLDDIPDSMLRLGHLLGTDKKATEAAANLRQILTSLRAQYSKRSPVRLFYQVCDQPLYTLNGKHIVSDAIRLCGGENIFSDMKITAPNVSVESVLQQDPEAIFGSEPRSKTSGINMWRRYATMTAVRKKNIFSLDDDLFSRAGPRMIMGAVGLCEKIEVARGKKKTRN